MQDGSLTRKLPGAVVEDVGWPPDEEVDCGSDSVGLADDDLAEVLSSVRLLQVLDLG